MTGQHQPYLGSCSFCGDGLLRFCRCENCDHIVVVCDECELMWEDLLALRDDTNLSSDTAFPQCPACGLGESHFAAVSMQELEDARYQELVEGESI